MKETKGGKNGENNQPWRGKMKRIDKNLTKHAKKRMQQRGIKRQVPSIILNFADKKIRVGNGSSALFISKKHLAGLQQRGKVPPQLVDKVSGKCLLIANDNSKKGRRKNKHRKTKPKKRIVTIFPLHGKASRPYRKHYRRTHDRSQKWKP